MSKLIKCKTCGNEIASSAKICPHCGARNKRKIGCAGIIVAFIFVVAIGAAIGGGKTSQEQNNNQKKYLTGKKEPVKTEGKKEPVNKTRSILENRFEYIKNIPDISSFFVTGNDVFIVLKNKTLPDDYGIICNAAAFNGSEALKKQGVIYNVCTVYLLHSEGTNIDKSKVIYKAVAIDGRVINSGDEPYGEKLKLQAMTPEQRKAYMLDKKAQENANFFEKKYVSTWDGSVRPVVNFVKSKMNNPDSFKHVKTNWWYIKGTTDQYHVKMIFRGTNALGGVVTNTVDLKVDLSGNVMMN